jgi:hypothetical protein
MENHKIKVIVWIKSGMNYSEGIALLVEITRKQFYSRMFLGRENTLKNKLAYEICKASQLADFTNWKIFISKIKNAPSDSILSVTSAEAKLAAHYSKMFDKSDDLSIALPSDIKDLIDTKNSVSYPPVIQRLIYATAELFQLRRDTHLKMCNLPETNSPSIISKRLEYFNQVKQYTEKLELYYKTRNNFNDYGTIPDERVLFPVDNQPSKQNAKSAGIIQVESLDLFSLKKMKKNLQTLNSKDHSVLNFQSSNHSGQKMPLPSGPKRSKLESRIQQRLKRITDIDNQLNLLQC